MVSSSLGLAGVGLALFAFGRVGFRSVNPNQFGSWREPPRWAKIVFGTVGGSGSPYRLSTELWGLTWVAGGLAIFATGNPPGSPLRPIVAGIMLLAVGACVGSWVLAAAGQALRDWRNEG